MISPLIKIRSKLMPQISTLVIALCLFSDSSLALGVGDTVDEDTLQQLNYRKDSILVVDFFAQWCESCRKELPLISKLNNQYQKHERIRFVGVDTDDDLAVAEAFQKELIANNALTFPVVNDVNQSIVSTFKPMGFPALYIIQNGKVVAEHLGAIPHIDTVIQKSLSNLTGH